jgi:hypothetical protein
MREFTKSMLSLSWAMSLFGLKQMADLLSPGSNTASVETVTRFTEEQLGTTTRSAFRAGDTLQRGIVDLTFTFLTFGFWQPGSGRGWGQIGSRPGGGGWNPGAWNPGGMGGMGGATGTGSGCSSCSSTPGSGLSGAAGDVTSQAMGAGMEMMQQGVNVAYQILGGGASQPPQQNTGWGPVPPPSGGGWRTYGGDSEG